MLDLALQLRDASSPGPCPLFEIRAVNTTGQSIIVRDVDPYGEVVVLGLKALDFAASSFGFGVWESATFLVLRGDSGVQHGLRADVELWCGGREDRISSHAVIESSSYRSKADWAFQGTRQAARDVRVHG